MTTHSIDISSHANPLALAFKKTQFRHPTLDVVMDQLRDIDQPAHRERIYVLTGPTGAGKSTAIDHYVRHLNSVYREEMKRDPSFVPYVLLRLGAPLDGRFNWKDTFVRLLAFFNEVLVERKVWHTTETSIDGTPICHLRLLVKEELRRALESCVKHRRTKVIILDEASALLLAAHGITMEEQFEIIKSIAVNLEVPIVLSGAYDLLGILECNSQLIRRTRVIHFPPYTEADFVTGGAGKGFRNFVHSLLCAMPVAVEPAVKKATPYFFIGSLGCAGLLKDWLQDALEATLKTKERTLTRKLLEETAYKKKALIKIAVDLQTGRELLTDVSLDDLLQVFRPPATAPAKPEKSEQAKKSPPRGWRKRPASKPARRIGIRKPARDPVGLSA